MKSSVVHRLYRGFHQRPHPRLAQISAVALACASVFGCSDRPGPSDDLEAILRDGDLTQMNRRALTVAAGDAGVGMGGSPASVDGGATDASSGMGGAGGVGPDGGFGTGGFGSGGFGGQAGGMGSGGGGGSIPEQAQGFWMFEDCFPERTELGDSSFNQHTAFRAVSAACVEGTQGQGIGIDESDDYVYVPDQPNFTFENGLTAAAWIKPTKLGDVRTILRKREGGTSTFVLASNGRDYQFVIRLDNGRAASVSARATLNVWTHVAGTYDGRELRLYLNGVLAARSRTAGRLSEGAGPLLMGNDAYGRRIDGAIDNVFFDTSAASAQLIAKLSCIPHPATLVATPAAGPTVPAGTEVAYDLSVTNNDSPTCEPRAALVFEAFSEATGISANPSFLPLDSLAPGRSLHVPFTVTSGTDVEPDDYPITVFVFSNDPPFDSASTKVTYSVQGTPCSVRSRKELEIRDISVVDDPVRTGPGGVWSFGHLMENMAPTAAAAPAMVEALLSTWLTDQTVNGFTVSARPAMQSLVLSTFPRASNGQLDLSKAPFRLLAIVNRVDLQDVSHQSAGEGRFVFGVLDSSGNPLQLTMIVEYNIPAASAQDVTNLANAWHALSSLPFPSEQYNVALQAVTERFTKRNGAPGRVNGSALGQFRSNDFFALGEWEFREFHLSPTTGQLAPAPVALTPDQSLNNTTALASYINANEADILQEKHTVPSTFQGAPFLGGSMITNFFVWNAPCVNPDAREKFARNTCNGCHTSPLETNTFVFQVSPRSRGEESSLSPFLLGTQVADFQAGVLRNFNELGRRNRILHALVCPTDPLPPPPPETTPIGGGTGGFGGRGGGTGGVTGAGGGAGPKPDPMTGSGGFVGSTGGAGSMTDPTTGSGGSTGAGGEGGGFPGTGGFRGAGGRTGITGSGGSSSCTATGTGGMIGTGGRVGRGGAIGI